MWGILFVHVLIFLGKGLTCLDKFLFRKTEPVFILASIFLWYFLGIIIFLSIENLLSEKYVIVILFLTSCSEFLEWIYLNEFSQRQYID